MNNGTPVISVHDQIVARLRADIKEGLLKAGEPLREVQLARRFGVSRSPIRQALHQLTSEGLLTARPNCGTVVAAPPTSEVRDALYLCRARLEQIALRQCLATLGEDDFRRYEEILAALYDTCERLDYVTADHHDQQFHRLMIDKATEEGSLGVYFAIAGATRDHSIDGNRTMFGDFRELWAIHASLLELFRTGDVEVAGEALVQHILREEFNGMVARGWYEAGQPHRCDKICGSLMEPLRQAAKRRTIL